jgi:DNA polymerase sigma
VAGIECDITVGNSTAVFKSVALKHVAAIDTRFPDLVRLVKAWAKAHDLNNAHLKTFNSFALTLMVRPAQ